MMYAKKSDANQKEIVEFFRKNGLSVFVTSKVGLGYPDLNVSFNNRTYLVEIKNTTKLNLLQEQFLLTWQDKVYIIKSIEDAKEFVSYVKRS